MPNEQNFKNRKKLGDIFEVGDGSCLWVELTRGKFGEFGETQAAARGRNPIRVVPPAEGDTAQSQESCPSNHELSASFCLRQLTAEIWQ